MHGFGWLDGDEGDQRYAYGIAKKHYDLHADLHRQERQVRSSQHDSNGEGQHDAGQRRVRIGERHDGIV